LNQRRSDGPEIKATVTAKAICRLRTIQTLGADQPRQPTSGPIDDKQTSEATAFCTENNAISIIIRQYANRFSYILLNTKKNNN
jgi:hypothetical protein